MFNFEINKIAIYQTTEAHGISHDAIVTGHDDKTLDSSFQVLLLAFNGWRLKPPGRTQRLMENPCIIRSVHSQTICLRDKNIPFSITILLSFIPSSETPNRESFSKKNVLQTESPHGLLHVLVIQQDFYLFTHTIFPSIPYLRYIYLWCIFYSVTENFKVQNKNSKNNI